MSEQVKLIAQRIKELREISGITTQELAAQFNVSPETYMEYESGSIDIPVSFLYEVASKFNVELTAILTGGDPKLHTYTLVRKEKGVHVDRRQAYDYQSLAHNFIHKKAEPFWVTVAPDTENAPLSLNTHHSQEFNYVIEGTLKVVIDGHELVLNEGDSLFFDANYKHGMQALNGKPAKFIAVIV